MARNESNSGRRLTPRQVLRLFHAPMQHRATRRQVLGGLLGTAAFGCATTGKESDSAHPSELGAEGEQPGAGQVAGEQPGAGATAGGQVATSPSATSAAGAEPAEASGQAGGQAAGEATSGEQAAAGEAGEQATGEQPASGEQASGEQAAEGESPGEPAESEAEPSEIELQDPEPEVTPEPVIARRSAYDLVELGNTGIVISRLAMGSGTTGFDGSSAQTRMGEAFTQLLVDSYDRGVRFFETADAYGSHGRVGDAMQQVGRQNVVLLTKTMAESRREAEADLERFMEELKTDYLDIVLLHIRTSADWVAESEGAMEVLAEAKARGQIRAHGVSCHSLAALRLAAETDWVDVDLARINPFGLHMDSDPQTVIEVLEGMKAQGKGVLGMKILGQGDAVDRFDEAIEHATRLQCIHGFTIGFRNLDELDQVASKIAAVEMAP